MEWVPRFLGTNIPSQALFPCQSWARRECSPTHGLVAWREQVPGRERGAVGRGGAWGAEGSPHPGSSEASALPRTGHPRQGPQHLGSLCLPPAMRGELQNICFLNKALHLGKALRVCAVLGAECPGRVAVLVVLGGAYPNSISPKADQPKFNVPARLPLGATHSHPQLNLPPAGTSCPNTSALALSCLILPFLGAELELLLTAQ